MNDKNKKVAILYSGGLDSLITAWLYYMNEYDITLIHFDYGQHASKIEKKYTEEFTDYIDAKLITINTRDIFKVFSQHSILLNKDNNISANIDTLKEAESDLNYVPMRNLILLSYASAICEINNIPKLAYGANLTESGNYPDNSIRFFRSLQKTLKVSGKQNFKLELKAPLINLTKTEILAIGIYYNAPIWLSVSCYYPTENNVHCGKCGSCLLRKRAFERLGYKNEITGKNLQLTDKVKQIVDKIETFDNIIEL